MIRVFWASFWLGYIIVLSAQNASYTAAKGSRNIVKIVNTELAKEDTLKANQYSILVYALDRKETLYSYRADVPMNPASVMKLLMTAAMLDGVGPDYQFRTEIYHEGDGNYCLKGHGDPFLSYDDLKEITVAVEAEGKAHLKKLTLDESILPGHIPYSKSFEEDYKEAYAAPIGALSLNYNLIYIKDDLVFPPLAGIKIRNIARNENDKDQKPRFIYRGDTILFETFKPKTQPVDDPALFTGLALFQALKDQNMVEENVTPSKSTFPRGICSGTPLYTHFSKPLLKGLELMLVESRNFVADMLFFHHAMSNSQKDASDAMCNWLKNCVNIDPQLTKVDLGSGMSRKARVSAWDIVKIIEHLTDTWNFDEIFPEIMAEAQKEGTMKQRLPNLPKEVTVYAKTGSLDFTDVTAGVVSIPQKSDLAFAIFMNGHAYSHVDARKFQDRIITAFVREYLASPP